MGVSKRRAKRNQREKKELRFLDDENDSDLFEGQSGYKP